jgi:UPF0271 protein
MTRTIDLNCDIGESFGAWKMGDDAALLAETSSANVACGFHAGDPDTMQRTVALAAAAGIAIGAHVSLPDLVGFGRREMRVTADQAYAMTLYQIGALSGFVRAAGQRLIHVKPHGALYNMAARDGALADAIAHAVRDFDVRLVLVGLAGGELVRAGRDAGVRVAREAFVERRYESDASLTPRNEPGAVIETIDAAIEQALSIVLHGEVVTRDGQRIALEADTLCIHGDRPDAAALAQALRRAFDSAGVRIAAPGGVPA